MRYLSLFPQDFHHHLWYLVVLGLPTFPPFILDRCFTQKGSEAVQPHRLDIGAARLRDELSLHLFLGKWRVLDLQCKLLD